MIISEAFHDADLVDDHGVVAFKATPGETVKVTRGPIYEASDYFKSIPEVAELQALLPEGCYVERMDQDLGMRQIGCLSGPTRTKFEVIDSRVERENPCVEDFLPADKYRVTSMSLVDYNLLVDVELIS